MVLILFTGLSGSGKSTLAFKIKKMLKNRYEVEIVDGDVYRNKLIEQNNTIFFEWAYL